MSAIKSRKHPVTRPTAGTSMAATLLTGLALGASFGAQAQSTAGPSAETEDQAGTRKTKTLDTVEVKGAHIELASPKYTQPLQDTPQTIQVICSELFKEQGATTLSEALRNSAGVGTFYAGENGNTATGDTVYMRGFDTSSSILSRAKAG